MRLAFKWDRFQPLRLSSLNKDFEQCEERLGLGQCAYQLRIWGVKLDKQE
jgi:hypothetical protein